MQIIRTVWSGQIHIQWLLCTFATVTLIAPTAVFWGIHIALRAIEKTALPWYGIFITAALILLVLVPMAILFGVGTYRAASQAGSMGVIIKCVIALSILWVPALSLKFFMLISGLLGLQEYL